MLCSSNKVARYKHGRRSKAYGMGSMITKRPAGGAATASGMNFQYCATAWVAVWVLAEKEVSPPWDLPVGTTLEWLRCETEHPVDDLLVGTSDGGFVFSQIKHTLHLSMATDSALASAIDQFVRQFVTHWERPLDPARDRLVLITGPSSSVPLRVHLPVVLGRLRRPAHSQSLDDAAANKEERRALAVIVGHIKRSWQAALGVSPSDDEVQQCLSLIRVHVLDIDAGGVATQEAKDRLRATVLCNPEQAEMAWALLIALCAAFAAGRSGTDRAGLQQVLLDAGIDIQASRSYRDDIERLRTYSRTTADFLAHLAHIRVGTTKIKIQRRSIEELRRVAEDGMAHSLSLGSQVPASLVHYTILCKCWRDVTWSS